MIARKKPLKRGKPPKRGQKPIKRSRIKTTTRSKEEGLRVYGTQEFRDHLHATPCLGCGTRTGIQQAHFGKHPMGKKNDWTRTGPLCHTFAGSCHDRLDRRGRHLNWFTAVQRELLEARLVAFHADWRLLLRGRAAVNPAPSVSENA